MSEVKVNKISPRSGTTVTLGDSGDTFTIPSGATINNQGTATNFGATGSASWTTTVKTSGFTAVAGEGYFVDTSSGAVSVNLPAGTPGAVVAFKDYLNSFDTHNLTLVQNGSDKIGGSTVNATISEEGVAVTLIFIDSTRGWLVTDSGLQSEAPTEQFIAATGGNTTITCGNFKTHIFTGPGTFCVSNGGNSGGSNSVEYLVVAGGGSGGAGRVCGYGSGGGGAGGFRTYTDLSPASPLNAPAKLPVSVQGYPITVGAGGSGMPPGTPSACKSGARGSSSIFSTITSTGGGGGIRQGDPNASTRSPGGSGGGNYGNAPGTGGSGNTPPVTPAQGKDGGISPGSPYTSGGGGGAATVGFAGGSNGPQPCGGDGGTGDFIPTGFIGPTAPSYGEPGPAGRYFAGGGGGGQFGGGGAGPIGSSEGGLGGGGNGAGHGGPTNQGITSGTTNTGGGGGGGGGSSPSSAGTSGSGGSGIVIIRYKFQ